MILKFLHGFSYTPHCEIVVLSLSIFGKKYKSDVRIKALDILKKTYLFTALNSINI